MSSFELLLSDHLQYMYDHIFISPWAVLKIQETLNNREQTSVKLDNKDNKESG